ncbi:MAG: HNH endonuclease [Methylomicrobium sp.]|nr:HNH endonuclease [Methylomicrobium sp.]
MPGHIYTNEEKQWLRENRPVLQAAQLAQEFNQRFNANVSKNAIAAYCRRHGISSGHNGQFCQGNVPVNKGKKGGVSVSPATTFKNGNLPHNTLPVGTELLRKDGYIWVKIAHPRTWREKHVIIWEQANGPRPKGHAIIFLDSDINNFDLANLACVSRSELLKMNHNQYKKTPAPLKPVVLRLSKLQAKCGIKPDITG